MENKFRIGDILICKANFFEEVFGGCLFNGMGDVGAGRYEPTFTKIEELKTLKPGQSYKFLKYKMNHKYEIIEIIDRYNILYRITDEYHLQAGEKYGSLMDFTEILKIFYTKVELRKIKISLLK